MSSILKVSEHPNMTLEQIVKRRHVADIPDKFRQPSTRQYLSVWSVFIVDQNKF